jgi:indolepyruvate ferredoxin oxidoreductase beta subunit
VSELYNILFAGVGGQGVLKASDLLAYAAMAQGLDVKKSEVHGMSQRGGSVTSHVKLGTKVYSPLIETGTADFLVGFEELEAYRCLEYMKPGGTAILNTMDIKPAAVLSGKEKYPDHIAQKIRDTGLQTFALNAFLIANACGSTKALNVVMLGTLAHYLPIEEKNWIKAIEEIMPAKFVELNKAAFSIGLKEAA